MEKKSCHFYTPKRCGILTEMLCESGRCSFYKTTEEFKDGLRKYPTCNYAAIYARKHKKDKSVVNKVDAK